METLHGKGLCGSWTLKELIFFFKKNRFSRPGKKKSSKLGSILHIPGLELSTRDKGVSLVGERAAERSSPEARSGRRAD